MSNWRIDVNLEPGALAGRAERAAEDAVRAAGEDILKRAMLLAPVDSGELRASASVSVDGHTARIAFGAPYAVYQHENAALIHPRGGQARFLADALEAPATLRAMASAFTL